MPLGRRAEPAGNDLPARVHAAVHGPVDVPRPVSDGLRYGCNWHGRLLSDGCCECGMLKFWRREIDAGRAVES